MEPEEMEHEYVCTLCHRALLVPGSGFRSTDFGGGLVDVCHDCWRQLTTLALAEWRSERASQAEAGAGHMMRAYPDVSEELVQFVDAWLTMERASDPAAWQQARHAVLERLAELEQHTFEKGMAQALLLAERPDLMAENPRLERAATVLMAEELRRRDDDPPPPVRSLLVTLTPPREASALASAQRQPRVCLPATA